MENISTSRKLPQKVSRETSELQYCVLSYSNWKLSKYNQFFHPRYKKLLIDPGLAWDHFFGRRRAEDVFAFHEFYIFFDLVFCKMPENIMRQQISSRMALVLQYVISAGVKWLNPPTCGQPHRSHNFLLWYFVSMAKKNYGHLITFKSSSSKYKVFPGSIAMDFIFEFAIIGWVFAKLRLINDKIDLLTHQSDQWLLSFPM